MVKNTFGDIVMYNGDCMEFMRGVSDKFYDLAIVDPPYGIDFQSARRIERKRKKKILNDNSPFIDWCDLLYQTTNTGGAVICFYRFDVQDAFKSALEQVGFIVKGQIVWDKVIHGMGDLDMGIAPQHELALYAVKGKRKFHKNRPKSIIRVQRERAMQMIHPNEKPAQLYREIIDKFAFPGDAIIDLFGGSGSICIACHDMGFSLDWIELDAEYYSSAVSRVAAHVAQGQLFTPEEQYR